ncbi:MAG: sensor histidine kinase [Lachnospiraceae bacterium]|nr:sensor histidine kinase [Lachnospiraceae bacterium]
MQNRVKNPEQAEKMPQGRSLSSALKRIIFFIVFMILLSFLVSIILITRDERREYTIRESENVLTTLSSSIQSDLTNYAELSRLIMMDDKLQEYLRAPESEIDIGRINDARYAVMDILNVTEGVDTVMIFREDLIYFSTKRFSYKFDTERLDGMDWREEILAAKGRTVMSLNSNGIAELPDGKPVLTIGRAIYDLYSQQRTGILFMNISPAVFERMLGQLQADDICICGSDGTYLAGNISYMEYFDDVFLAKGVTHRDVMQGGSRMLLSGTQIGDTPVVILRMSSYGTAGTPYRILYVLLILMVFFVFVVLGVGTFITRNVTRPIFEFSRRMERNKQSGELKKIDLEMPYSELNMLKGDYNDMIDHVNDLIATTIEQEQTLQRAQMRVLQEQIKPHFLYNSIETIGFLAMDAGAERVYDALETLGSFYRNFLSKGDREIRLTQEVQIVRDYLSLQKLRYGDIIEDEYDIADEAGDFMVPRLILQPLVENSIYHGIRLKGERGIIRVGASVSQDTLHLSVRDTGVGMPQEMIDRVLSGNRGSAEEEAAESFGLWGTIERVRIYCGREDVVSITSEPGEYTEVVFHITRGGI